MSTHQDKERAKKGPHPSKTGAYVHHQPTGNTQQPDSRPGFYYVSVRKNSGTAQATYRLLRGPFINDHPAALAAVAESQRRAIEYDPRGIWYSYGTCWAESDLGLGLFDKQDALTARQEPTE